jgi:hypothetical protein
MWDSDAKNVDGMKEKMMVLGAKNVDGMAGKMVVSTLWEEKTFDIQSTSGWRIFCCIDEART